MNSSAWAYFFVLMGILGLVIINTSSNLLMTNEQDYFILKEVTEAAMVDAIDYRAYREGLGYDNVTSYNDPDSMHCITGQPGTIRILKEKFVENFTLRFANAVDMAKKYKIVVNDIQECPPKVTVTLVSTHAFDFVDVFTDADVGEAEIVNRITAILENTPAEYEKNYTISIDQINQPDPTPNPQPVVTPEPQTTTQTPIYNKLVIDANGGNGTEGTWTQTPGTTLKIKVTKNGYDFRGWEKNGTCGNYTNRPTTTYTFPNSNNTECYLKAKWILIPQPRIATNTLVVDANGGTGSNTWTQEYNTTVNITVERKNYIFEGWSKDGPCGSYTNEASTTYKFPDNDGTKCTLKANWKPKVYTIKLDNQGANETGTKYIYEYYGIGIYKDEALTKLMTNAKNSIAINFPKKYDSYFKGYFTEKKGKGIKLIGEGSGRITKNFTSTFFESDATIYANWQSEEGNSSGDDDGKTNQAPSTPSSTPSPAIGGLCFLAGTKINTLFGYINIEDIKPGTMVLSYNEKLQKNEYNKVNALIIHENAYDNIYYLTVEGNEIEIGQDHPLYVKNEDGIRWKKPRVLKVGDSVMLSDGTFHKIEKIRYEFYHGTEYNLSVYNTHNFYVSFGNDVLVHNRGQGGIWDKSHLK